MVSCLAQKRQSSHNGVRGPLWPADSLPWLGAPSTKFQTSPPTTRPSPLCSSHCVSCFSGHMPSMFLPPGTLHFCLRTLFCQISTWVALKVSVQMWGSMLHKTAPICHLNALYLTDPMCSACSIYHYQSCSTFTCLLSLLDWKLYKDRGWVLFIATSPALGTVISTYTVSICQMKEWY